MDADGRKAFVENRVEMRQKTIFSYAPEKVYRYTLWREWQQRGQRQNQFIPEAVHVHGQRPRQPLPPPLSQGGRDRRNPALLPLRMWNRLEIVHRHAKGGRRGKPDDFRDSLLD
jgi:hypothetical protein